MKSDKSAGKTILRIVSVFYGGIDYPHAPQQIACRERQSPLTYVFGQRHARQERK